MRRRTFIMLIGGAAAWPLSAGAQQAAKLRRVAYLALLPGPDAVIVKGRLAELGYIEGKNLIFDLRSAEGLPERLPDLASELVRTNPDVIVAGFGTLTAKSAQAATTTIPIVFSSVGDPIGAGIVQSLSPQMSARPCAGKHSLSRLSGRTPGDKLPKAAACWPADNSTSHNHP
jgi:putative ABC transport system substrate-binding protein